MAFQANFGDNVNNTYQVTHMKTIDPFSVFVGGLARETTEHELFHLFSRYGRVMQAKIVATRGGLSKGYGFVRFEHEEEATRLHADVKSVILRDRRLNIQPAVKKTDAPTRLNDNAFTTTPFDVSPTPKIEEAAKSAYESYESHLSHLPPLKPFYNLPGDMLARQGKA